MDAVTSVCTDRIIIKYFSTHFSNISLGHQQDQVYVVNQPQYWCGIRGGGYHSTEVC